MRETLAKASAAALTALIVALSALFADRRNAPEAFAPPPRVTAGASPQTPDPSLVERGRALYDELSCGRCHSVEGSGNPRTPLDGVGLRRPATDLGAWVTGEGEPQRTLSRSTLRAKAEFRRLPPEQLEALVAYLSSLR